MNMRKPFNGIVEEMNELRVLVAEHRQERGAHREELSKGWRQGGEWGWMTDLARGASCPAPSSLLGSEGKLEDSA